jgi:DNA polymerase I-like protein with 3'-5' exonuclease and polymerase domains
MHYHPSFRVPGTHTGRLAGAGGFNGQNPPKSLHFLRCFTVPDDYVIITCDHSSLEDYVLAELSRDMSLWDFYGPESRKGNCMYLSVGSRLPVLGDKIKEAGYDPDNWTPESVKAAKKKASKWRQVAKAIVLGANYGAGPPTLHKQLTDNNIDIDIEDVFKMHKGFWKLRQGVKVWEKELRRQWEDNGGWILNGIGRPICLEPMRDKDLVNATVQSSGHDAHMLFQVLIAEHLSRDGFDWHPWHMDMHDCSMFAVRADQAEAACNLLTYVIYPELNKMLGGEIALKGDPNVCITWADDKDEERRWEEDINVKERINKLRKAISWTC